MTEIANHGNANLSMIEVAAGKQSTDIHIGSYLGFLLGKYGKNCKVVVISKDTDFDKVIAFWKERTGAQISRSPKIKGGAKKSEPAAPPEQAKKASKKPARTVNKTASASSASKEKNALNTKVMQTLSQAGYTSDVVTSAASIAVRNYGEKNGKQKTYRNIISRFGQADGLAVYRNIKNLL